MSDYKYHLSHRFGTGCTLVAMARDEHRNREIKLYHMPGNFEYVGVNDGVDVWICPVNADPFGANTPRLFEDIRTGKRLDPPSLAPKKRERKVASLQMQLPLVAPQPTSRERRKPVLVAPSPIPQPTRSRRVATR